jgi:cell division transport system permease protein
MKTNADKASARQLRQAEPMKRKFTMRKRIIKYGLSNFVRNIWLSLAAIIVMSFTLLTVFMAAAATVVLNDTVEMTKIEKLNLSLYLRSSTPQQVQNDLKAELEADPNVSHVSVFSKEEVLASLEANMTIDADTLALIEEGGEKIEDILPISFGIHVRDVNDVGSLVEVVNGENSEFKSYLDASSYEFQFFNDDSQKTIQNMSNIANTAQLVGLSLGGIFLFITILVIFNTIRLAIFARKDEIEMEKLIGAEKYYVRGPFLAEAGIYGIISGIIAVTLGYVLIISFIPAVLTGESVSGVNTTGLNAIMIGWVPLVVIGTILLGMLIGDLSARLAVRKYLRY